MDKNAINDFLAGVAEESGEPALSEAKLAGANDDRHRVVVAEDNKVMAVGVVAFHAHDDGTTHVAAETAVLKSMQFPAFEAAVVESTMELVVSQRDIAVWSRRSTLDTALTSMGFACNRTLARMVCELPVGLPKDSDRSIRRDELAILVDINNAAFAGHREASSLTMDDVIATESEGWFDLEGIRVIESNAEIAAFCWTKVHPNGDGEIYRIGVRPGDQGTGLGRSALLAGFRYVASRSDVSRGVLWVDISNVAAMELYESIGMWVESTNREFRKSADQPNF